MIILEDILKEYTNINRKVKTNRNYKFANKRKSKSKYRFVYSTEEADSKSVSYYYTHRDLDLEKVSDLIYLSKFLRDPMTNNIELTSPKIKGRSGAEFVYKIIIEFYTYSADEICTVQNYVS